MARTGVLITLTPTSVNTESNAGGELRVSIPGSAPISPSGTPMPA
jgi:hypothetical protein